MNAKELEAQLVENTLEIPVQVSGKLRDVIKVPATADNAIIEATARASDKVKPFLNAIWKVVIVEKKLVNILTLEEQLVKKDDEIKSLKEQVTIRSSKLVEAVNALEHLLALYMHTVYGSYDGKAEQPTPVEQARKIIQEHKP